MKKLLVLWIFVILAMSIAGCGAPVDLSDSGKTSSSDKSGADASDSADVEETSDSKDEDSSFADKFKDFAAKKMATEFTVTYDQTIKNEGATQKLAMTQYFGGPTKYRSDMTVQGHETRSYVLDKTFYACNDMSGAWQCLKIENQEQNTASFDNVESNPDKYDYTFKGTKTVAGALTYCYEIAVPPSVMTECFTKEGVPLYMKVTGSGADMEMIAKSYKTSVSDSDFSLPAEATDMNAMMAQYQQQAGTQ